MKPANIYIIVRYIKLLELKILYETDSFDKVIFVGVIQIRLETATKTPRSEGSSFVEFIVPV